MKSSSKIFPRSVQEQLKPWDIAELNFDGEEPSREIDKEQILALFRNGSENRSSERENGSRSTLHHAGTNLVLTGWQPGDLNAEPPLKVVKEWFFAEVPNDIVEVSEKENWKEQPNTEQETASSLNQAHVEAEEILLEARAQADQLLLQAEEEIEQEKKNGFQEGWNGARSEMQQALQAASAMVAEIQKWQKELMSQGEQTIIEMLKEIAQTMFGEGVHLDANALQINLNRIMENAQRLGDLNIFLNPRDVNLLDPSWKEYQFLISGNKVRVIPSEKITAGGCIVKGNTGMVDGRVETQLAAILNTFDELREVAQ